MSHPFSLYLHVPFCQQKCPYCDFNTYAVATVPEREYLAALASELDHRAVLPEWRQRTVQSIYFGGGTPSLLSPSGVRRTVRHILQLFPGSEALEVSLEANPNNLSLEQLAGYHDAGVNRISFGAQSFDGEILKRLGRAHTPEQIETAVGLARQAGIENINIDLMFGTPGQKLEQLQHDLMEVARLEVPHVSAYGLTIEKGTPFFNSYRKGHLALPRESLVLEMMRRITLELRGCGLSQYEISNYSMPGSEARHNMAYWNGDDYLGLGAGAHSFSAASGSGFGFGRRWANTALPAKYIELASAHGKAESWHEELDVKSAVFEYFFLGLRKIAGVSIRKFEQRFGCSMFDIFPTSLEALKTGALLKQQGDTLALTEKGLYIADSVFECLASVDVEPDKVAGISAAPAAPSQRAANE